MANFVNKLPRGTGRYKGRLPLKCFNCGKIRHFAAKCPHKGYRGMSNQNKYQFKGRMMTKQNFYSKADDEVSDFDEDEENSDLDIIEILFLAMENQHHHEESNEETTVVDLEAELVTDLEEIENLRDINKKQTREYVTAKR